MSAEDFNHSLELINQAFVSGLKGFISWAEINWKMEQEKTLSPDYCKGWDTAISELRGALDVYLEEYGY